MSKQPKVRTVYVGQFSWERANAIAAKLEEAGIAWWHKQGGTLSRLLFAEWGVRMFADRARIDEVRTIVDRTPEPGREPDAPEGPPPEPDAPEPDAPEGDAPEGDAPEGDAPEGDAPEGPPPESR